MNAQAGYLAKTRIHRYLGGLLAPFVSLLEAHKLKYFAQQAGACAFLDQHANSRERFERVTRIVEGFESPTASSGSRQCIGS
jgi:hypothetical protein